MENTHSELHAKRHLKCNTDACCRPTFVGDLRESGVRRFFFPWALIKTWRSLQHHLLKCYYPVEGKNKNETPFIFFLRTKVNYISDFHDIQRQNESHQESAKDHGREKEPQVWTKAFLLSQISHGS